MNHKGNGSFLMLIIAIVVLAVGFLVFTSVINDIDGTTPANNLTCSAVNSTYNIYAPMLVVIVACIILGLMFFHISSPERYLKNHKFLMNIIAFFDTTTYYFAFGLMFIAICAVVITATYLLISLLSVAGESGVGIEIGKWALILIAGYFGIAGIGYLFKKYVWDRWQKTKKQAEYIKNMEELPGAI